MKVSQVAVRNEHFELRVKGKERLEKVLLRPKAAFVHYPIATILEREEDVMHMHDHARIQTWQYFQEKIVYIAADLYRVRAIDKEHVAGLKLREEIEPNILHFLLEQRTADRGSLSFRKSSGNGSTQTSAESPFFAAA